MTDADQTKRFAEEIDRVVDHFRKEYNITLASAVGVLQIKAFLLMQEHCNGEE